MWVAQPTDLEQLTKAIPGPSEAAPGFMPSSPKCANHCMAEGYEVPPLPDTLESRRGLTGYARCGLGVRRIRKCYRCVNSEHLSASCRANMSSEGEGATARKGLQALPSSPPPTHAHADPNPARPPSARRPSLRAPSGFAQTGSSVEGLACGRRRRSRDATRTTSSRGSCRYSPP